MNTDDHLLEHYREANALDPARPAPAVRENVLARARTVAIATSQDKTRPAAANDASWRWRALGGLAVLGLATLVVLQFERGAPEERETAVGRPSAPATAPADTEARERAPAAAKPSAPPPPPPAARARPVPPAAPTAPAPSAPAIAQEQDSRADDALAEGAPRARAQPRLEAQGALARGADVNAADPQGRTALMLAAQRGDVALVRRLLDAGADPLRRDREGRTAADLAREAGHDALLPLLEAASTPPSR